MANDDIEPRKCTTPKFRVSFPNVFKPKSFKDGEPKYSITMLFDKKTDLAKMKLAARNAGIQKFGPVESWPKDKNGKSKLRMPFRDGDDEKAEMDGYENCIFVNASSKSPPQVIEADGKTPIVSEVSLYAGCYARASLIAFGYDESGNKGISFALQNIQKWEDGEPFSGKPKAEDEFEAIEGAGPTAQDDGEEDPFA